MRRKVKIMGTVYRKSFTKLLPVGGEVIVRKGERLARSNDAKATACTVPMGGGRGRRAEPDYRDRRHVYGEVSRPRLGYRGNRRENGAPRSVL